MISYIYNVVELMTEKTVHLKIDKHTSDMTLDDILKTIEKIQKENPDLEVFFDGDEYAICSIPKKA